MQLKVNPADVFLGVLEYRGITTCETNQASFDEWRRECEEKSYEVDLRFEPASTVYDFLSKIAQAGRRTVFANRGGWFTVKSAEANFLV